MSVQIGLSIYTLVFYRRLGERPSLRMCLSNCNGLENILYATPHAKKVDYSSRSNHKIHAPWSEFSVLCSVVDLLIIELEAAPKCQNNYCYLLALGGRVWLKTAVIPFQALTADVGTERFSTIFSLKISWKIIFYANVLREIWLVQRCVMNCLV
jgi:hypothetical protein